MISTGMTIPTPPGVPAILTDPDESEHSDGTIAEDPAAGFDAHKARTREGKNVVEKLAEREAALSQEIRAFDEDGDTSGFEEENPTRRVTAEIARADDGE